jgi:hypothetical protein
VSHVTLAQGGPDRHPVDEFRQCLASPRRNVGALLERKIASNVPSLNACTLVRCAFAIRHESLRESQLPFVCGASECFINCLQCH